MTGQHRLRNILDGNPVDRPAWTTLVGDRTRSVMPAEFRNMPVIDFYRHIGCEIFLFGNYGLPQHIQVAHPALWVSKDTVQRSSRDGELCVTELISP